MGIWYLCIMIMYMCFFSLFFSQCAMLIFCLINDLSIYLFIYLITYSLIYLLIYISICFFLFIYFSFNIYSFLEKCEVCLHLKETPLFKTFRIQIFIVAATERLFPYKFVFYPATSSTFPMHSEFLPQRAQLTPAQHQFYLTNPCLFFPAPPFPFLIYLVYRSCFSFLHRE